MQKRLLLLFGGFMLLLVGTGLVAVSLTLKSPISRENCEKIQPGMTEAEVEAILGGPAGDYSGGRVFVFFGFGPPGYWTAPWKTWTGPEGGILVRFDSSGRVEFANFREPTIRLEEPLLDRLRRRLGL